MRTGDSIQGVLPQPGVDAVADAIREAIGAAPEEDVSIVTPQFTRPRGFPVPGQPPETLEDFDAYRSLSMADLVALGFGNWDDSLALLPGEWHRKIPKGAVLECISGEKVEAGRDYINADIRYGCLAYGIRASAITYTP